MKNIGEEQASTLYIGDTRNNVFHKMGSGCLKKIPAAVLIELGKTPQNNGFTPCHKCYGKANAADIKTLDNASIKDSKLRKRLIDGSHADARNIIARCHLIKHRGYLTKKLVSSHNCIAKKCNFFEKLKPEYWLALEQAERDKSKQRHVKKQAKRELIERDEMIKETLEDSGCVYVTSIRDESSKLLVISYIYDRKIDLSAEIKFLREKLGKTVKLQAKIGTEEAIEQLIKKPRRDMHIVTDVRKAPKVGNATKKRLVKLGVFCLEDLYGRNGDALYRKDCELSGGHVNRRYLDAYCSAVEYAHNMESF